MSRDEIVIDLSYGEDKAYRTRTGDLAGTVVYNAGDTYRPFDDDPGWNQKGPWGKQQTLEHASITTADGKRLDGKAKQRVIDRLLGRYEQMAPVYDPTAPGEETRAYVPGLWNHGTTPALSGPKGWGKTRFMEQLPAALIIPGLRLLNYFDSAEMSEQERERDVWMINPETRPRAVHDGLIRAGLVFGYRDGVPCYHPDIPDWQDWGVLIVEHLRGQASTWDVTNPGKLDDWVDRMVELADRRMPPLTLIVDGVTAILGNDTTRYGEFAAALLSLQRLAEIPNGLGVLHSPMGPNNDTPMNGVESAAQWDGMWIAKAKAYPIEPATPRFFYTIPREGDPTVPRRRVVLDDDGLLQLVGVDEAKSGAATAEEAADDPRRALRKRLRKAGPEWTWTKALCGTGDTYKANKRELEEMERDGEVVSRHHADGRVRGYQWRLADQGGADDE